MRSCLIALSFAFAAVSLTGCGGTSLDPAVAGRYVEAEAHALCAVQSRAFASQKALERAFRASERSRISDAERQEAAAAAEKDAALRSRVSARVVELCGGGPTG